MTIQLHITREETNRRLRHPPIRPSLMPRLPISRGRLRYGETSVADCAPPQDESTPDALHPRKGCPRCGATNTPIPTLVLLSHHRSSRATCWMVWMFGTSDVAGYAVRGAFLFCSLSPIGLNVSLPFSRSQGRVRVSNLSLTTHSEPRATRRKHTRHRPSSENIGIPMRHAAADPDLATLSFHHASADMLV